MSILPQFITLNERTLEYYFPLPPIMNYAVRVSDSPADVVQGIAVYKYRQTIGEDMYQFELEGVEIRDTRLDTLHSRLTLTEQALEAARAYIEELEELITGEWNIFPAQADRDTYNNAIARLEEMK